MTAPSAPSAPKLKVVEGQGPAGAATTVSRPSANHLTSVKDCGALLSTQAPEHTNRPIGTFERLANLDLETKQLERML